MEKLNVQLTVEREPGRETPGRLAPRRVIEIGQFPCGKADGRMLGFELEIVGNGVSLKSDSATLNGKAVNGTVPLHIGDVIGCGGYEYGFYLKRRRPPLRFLCRFLAWQAKGIAGVCIAMELLVACALPIMLSQASVWDGSIMVQRMVQKIDSLRKRVAKLDGEGAMRRAIAAELSLELNERARYIRAYDRGIRRGQRREMMRQLERIDAILTRLEDKTHLAIDEIGAPDLDGAVKRTLEH